MSPADQLMALELIRAIDLQRVATWMLSEALADIDRLQRAMRSVILDAGFTNRRTTLKDIAIEKQVQSELRDKADEILAELSRRLVSQFREIEEIEREEQKQSIALVYGIAVSIPDTFSAQRFLVGGVTIPDHFSKMRDDLIFRIMATVRDSHAAGLAEEEMWLKIRGRKNDIVNIGEFPPTKRAIETTIRTGASAVQSRVQMDLDLSTKAPAHGWQHVSVLDNRTSETCRGRAWKKWDASFKPIGHSLPFLRPPLHSNCRSKMLLIFIDDQPATPVSFREWIEQLTAQQQNSIFGQENILRWKGSRISDAELVRQANRPLSIDELRKRAEARQGRLIF